MLRDFQQLFTTEITGETIILNLLVALICGIAIAWFYRKTHKFPGYSVNFVNSLVLLCMLTAVVIMVIGNNLARAFGLVGAMSIIRFRTAVKETQDIVFIFFALSIGMAAGVGYYQIAILGTILVGSLTLWFSRSSVSAIGKKAYLLQLDVDGTDENDAIMKILNQFCSRVQVVNAKTLDAADRMELSYFINVKQLNSETDLIKVLKNTAGVNHVNLFYDEAPF